MTKARTAAQKRRQRRDATITLPGGETAPEPPTGRDRRHTNAPDDPPAVALEARMRQTGATRDEARSDMLGCAVGRYLHATRPSDMADLWRAVRHMRRVALAYDHAVRAPNRHPRCLAVLTPADAMTASASSPAPDLRSEEERDRRAVSDWMAMHGWLAYVDRAAAAACIRAVIDEPDGPVRDGAGVILALRCVSEGISGAMVAVRDRNA